MADLMSSKVKQAGVNVAGWQYTQNMNDGL